MADAQLKEVQDRRYTIERAKQPERRPSLGTYVQWIFAAAFFGVVVFAVLDAASGGLRATTSDGSTAGLAATVAAQVAASVPTFDYSLLPPTQTPTATPKPTSTPGPTATPTVDALAGLPRCDDLGVLPGEPCAPLRWPTPPVPTPIPTPTPIGYCEEGDYGTDSLWVEPCLKPPPPTSAPIPTLEEDHGGRWIPNPTSTPTAAPASGGGYQGPPRI